MTAAFVYFCIVALVLGASLGLHCLDLAFPLEARRSPGSTSRTRGEARPEELWQREARRREIHHRPPGS